MKLNLQPYIKSEKTQRIASNWLLYFMCSFCLITPALYNSFPIVTQDTGMYIYSGFKFFVPIDRPITYGLFIRVSSFFGLSLWIVILAQSLILVHYMNRISIKLLGKYYTPQFFFFIVLFISAFTCASWFCSQLMPDVFTAIMILSIVDFYISPKRKGKYKVLTFFLISFYIEIHNSHLLIALCFCILARIYSLFTANRWFIKKSIFLFYITLFSFISISFFNLWEGNSFRPSASSHVFLMARMAEDGVLDEFLKDYCPTEHYSLCDYQGKTGDRYCDFMWTDQSHLHHLEGWNTESKWAKAEKEYNTIIFRSFTRPKFLGLQIYKSIEGMIRQLPQYMVEFIPQGKNSPPYNSVQAFYPREIKEYRTCLQQVGQLSQVMPFFNALMVIAAVLLTLIMCLLYNKILKTVDILNWNFSTFIILSLIFINALITATFSTIYCRMQSRVSWVLMFMFIIYILRYFLSRKDNKANH